MCVTTLWTSSCRLAWVRAQAAAGLFVAHATLTVARNAVFRCRRDHVGNRGEGADRVTNPSVVSPPDNALDRLQALFQLLRRPEGDLLAGLDLNCLARRRIPSHPRRQRPHLQDAETGQADFVAVL